MKLFKKLKLLTSKSRAKYGYFFLRKKTLHLFLLVVFSFLFIAGLTYTDSLLKKNKIATYTAEVAALPAGDNNFENGFVTPASCGVATPYSCGVKGDDTCYGPPLVDYNHAAWGACSPPSPPAAPTGLNASCNAAGTQATLSWNSVIDATYYLPRVTVLGGQPCPSGWTLYAPTTCYINSYAPVSVNFETTPNQNYAWWVFSGNSLTVPTNYGLSSFTCAGGPDLTADAATPATAIPGTNNTLSAVVRNIGTASTGGSFDTFFQVSDAAGGGGGITDITGAVVIGALAASGQATANKVYTFPGGPGTYSIRACADKTTSASVGVITETNEGNNCGSPWTDVTVACTGSDQWDTINSVCTDPQVVSAVITDQYYPPGDIRLECNADTINYSVWKGSPPTSVLFIAETAYNNTPITLNDVVTGSDTYIIKCIHGSVESQQPVGYDGTIPDPVVKLIATETSVDPPASTTLKWEVDYPTAACTLTAKVVCANNACTAAQSVNEAAVNAILSTTNTDSNDPATSRPILNAIQSPAPGHKDSDTPVIIADYKALGRKTIPIKYTTDITYNCNGTKETKRIRVIRSEEQ